MAIGIPWCRKENYDAFRAIFEDRKDLPPLWEEFARRAEEAEQFYQARGETVVRVDIDPQTFPDWCAENDKRVDARARYDFAWRRANPDDTSG